MGKKKSRTELLKNILATVNLSDLPPDLQGDALTAIAEIGGCAFCGRAATRLCDFSIGHEIDLEHTAYPCAKDDGEHFTCDAPLCEQCRVVHGWTTITGVPTDIDWCPYHSAMKGYKWRPMTKHEAEKMRIVAWKRTLFRVSP